MLFLANVYQEREELDKKMNEAAAETTARMKGDSIGKMKRPRREKTPSFSREGELLMGASSSSVVGMQKI
jgi:hypothetical protein